MTHILLLFIYYIASTQQTELA